MLLGIRSWPIQIAPTQYHHLELSLLKPYYKNPSPLKMFCLGNGVCLKTKKKSPTFRFDLTISFIPKLLPHFQHVIVLLENSFVTISWKNDFGFETYNLSIFSLSLQNSFCGFILLKNHSQIVLLLGFWKENLRKALLFCPCILNSDIWKNLFHLFFKKFYKTKKDLCSSKRVDSPIRSRI